MRRIDGVKVTCLTLGDLLPRHRQASLEGGVSGTEVSKGHSSCRIGSEGLNTRVNRCQTFELVRRCRKGLERVPYLSKARTESPAPASSRIKTNRHARNHIGER
jgi:hypothetical protein